VISWFQNLLFKWVNLCRYSAGQPEEEEVRLFYVGLTRAKRRLFLCRAYKRQRFGQTSYPDPSPFLAGLCTSQIQLDPKLKGA
jgi:superfamily I DNA/RNA helicase